MAVIERRNIVDALAAATPQADASGAVSAFGHGLMELPAFFWTSFSEKLMRAVPESDDAGLFLESSAARFAYTACHGILESAGFKAAAGGTGDPESFLRSAFCLAAAWGWADAEIVALHPPESMTVRARVYAEAEIAETMPLSKPIAFGFKGICRAFMDLSFGGPFPDGFGAYACRQVFALELGDPYGEFIVTRSGT
jgi:hypothetical protein